MSTIYGRRETNEQNARIERQLLVIGTAMTAGDFHRAVVQKLLDAHSCKDPNCRICPTRLPRTMADALQILADGTGQSVVHLFARWTPSSKLVEQLVADGIEIRAHGLSEIPEADLRANASYSIRDGTPAQEEEFLSAFWGPPWRARDAPAP